MAFDQTQRDLLLTLGHILVTRRQALGWTVREVQARSGLSPSVIHKYEHGQLQNAPRADVLMKLAIALDLSWGEITRPYKEYVARARARLPESIP